MFHSLRGMIIPVDAQRIVLSTAYGIEWSLACSAEAIAYWKERGGEQATQSGENADSGVRGEQIVYTHLIPRDDSLNLYGYYSEAERQLFLRLIKVNGVGAAVALNILSAMNVSVIWQMIEQSDHAALSKIPKIGTKSAQKIVLSLRGSVIFDPATAASSGAGAVMGAGDAVVESLVAMGYERAQAAGVVSELRSSTPSGGIAADAGGAGTAGSGTGTGTGTGTGADAADMSARRYEEQLFKEALGRLT